MELTLTCEQTFDIQETSSDGEADVELCRVKTPPGRGSVGVLVPSVISYVGVNAGIMTQQQTAQEIEQLQTIARGRVRL